MRTDALEQTRLRNMEHYGFGPSVMKRIKACAACGNPSAADLHFCTACGHRLPSETLHDLYLARHALCPVCRTVLTDSMEFCPQCGTKIHTPDSPKEKGKERPHGIF